MHCVIAASQASGAYSFVCQEQGTLVTFALELCASGPELVGDGELA